MSTSVPRCLARAQTCEYWEIGCEVYRVTTPETRDVHGVPSAKRWECSRAHWDRYRANYAFATDVAGDGVATPTAAP